MPTNQRVGFDDGEGVPPVEETGQLSQCKANGIVSSSWFDFALDIYGELFAQKQVLGLRR